MAQPHPHLHIVILCEDYGSRLWPIAREQAPACLAPAAAGSDESLLAATVGRVRDYTAAPLHVVTTEQLASVIRSELLSRAGLAPDELDLLVEPVERGSAFSVALAVAKIRHDDPGAVVAVFPSNQKVSADERWDNLVSRAYAVAEQDRVVLIGGQQEEKCAENTYIRTGRPLEDSSAFEVRLLEVDAEPAGARRARKEGALWYTGVFFARAARVVGDLLHAGESSELGGADNPARIVETANFLSLLDVNDWLKDDARKLIETLPRMSYEQTAFKRSRHLAVLPTSINFSTVNSLEDLETVGVPDNMLNRLFGAGYNVHSRNTTIYAQGAKRRVITLGMRDAVVIDTPDALLVAQKERLRDMDEVFDALRAAGDEQERDVPASVQETAPDEQVASEQSAAPATQAFGWGSAKLMADEPASAIWRLRMLSEAKFESLSVPRAYGRFGEGAFREQYVVTDGAVEIRGAAGDAVSMSAGDAFEVDADDPLSVRAVQAATLILVAVAS